MSRLPSQAQRWAWSGHRWPWLLALTWALDHGACIHLPWFPAAFVLWTLDLLTLLRHELGRVVLVLASLCLHALDLLTLLRHELGAPMVKALPGIVGQTRWPALPSQLRVGHQARRENQAGFQPSTKGYGGAVPRTFRHNLSRYGRVSRLCELSRCYGALRSYLSTCTHYIASLARRFVHHSSILPRSTAHRSSTHFSSRPSRLIQSSARSLQHPLQVSSRAAS